MPNKHHRPAALQKRSTSGSNTKLALANLNFQKLDSSSNLQLQVALNNATKDLPRGKGKKSGGRPNLPPSRTASDQQIRSSSKLHLQQQQPHTQRTTTGASRPISSQRADTISAIRSDKKSGFTLTSPVVATQEIESEGDSDEWVSSESVSVTPQNQSSDSESGDDDDVVHNLPTHLNLTGMARIATSPGDREPPTPTVPQVKMQSPTPVNKVKEETRRSSTVFIPDETMGTGAVVDDTDRHDRERTIMSTADGHTDVLQVRHVDQQSVRDRDYPHSDHHAHPEEGLASTPRPRAMVDRDTEPSRYLPPDSLSDPPHSDSTVRKPLVVNPRLAGDVRNLLQRSTLSAHSVPQSHPRITSDSSPGPKADNNPMGKDQVIMTQVSEDPPVPIITKSSHV
ncbi:hypothetical protein BDM02DRAFT_1115348 [Thelephora ganbajun]|uniref:Uncharacterized protein n=1 Tax=Thelephora ganbajun TaxID=370292 RepID=A0ACB6ZXB7_THEGA|nr:hypothetical protein BDM02DRAFT_1115348 [Thelephora ganbajun]